MLDLRKTAKRPPARRQRSQIGQELGGSPLQPLEPRQMLAADVLTYHNNLSRTGTNTDETTLTPANVNVGTFGKVGQVKLDGQVYAQPLYKSNVAIPGRGIHDVVYVATAHDSLYAFDADNLSLLWYRNFTNPALGITTVKDSDVQVMELGPELGIMGTPVIDPASNTIYFVTRTKTVSAFGVTFEQQLQALDLGTGRNKFGSPTVIQATVPGTGDGSVGGKLTFDPHWQLQRSGLLLLNGVVYVTWASHATHDPYHGWIMGFDAKTLRRVSTLVTTPDERRGGIWMSGGAPAADAQGNIYLAVGNGTFDADTGGRNYGDSVLKIQTKGRGRRKFTPKIVDYFTPSNEKFLDTFDRDLGSGGVVLLPDQNGAVPQELVAGGKEGIIFILNRNFLGQYSPFGNRVVQELPAINQQYDTPAFYNGNLYYVATGAQKPGRAPNVLVSFQVRNGVIVGAQAGKYTYGYPGSTPSVSSNGAFNGIVWTLDNGNSIWGPSVLRAYDANNVKRLLYASDQAGERDTGGTAIKFSVPTVADGRVYVGGTGYLTVYGLRASG